MAGRSSVSYASDMGELRVPRNLTTSWQGRALAGLAFAALLAGCGGVRIKAEDSVPPPLVDALPLRAGLYYSPEFRNYAAREERWSTKWEVSLGAGHVAAIDRLARAMFANLVPVADLTKPPQPPLDLILEPRFEEYDFVTPRDAGAEIFAVTIKYRINVYDGAGRLIDSLVLTGYGNENAGGLTSTKPLTVATRKAMRDAGAKFAIEFPEQPVVQKLVRHELVEPLAAGAAAAPAVPAAVGEVPQPSGPPPPPKTTAPATAAPPAGPPAAGGSVPAETIAPPEGGAAAGPTATPAPSRPPPASTTDMPAAPATDAASPPAPAAPPGPATEATATPATKPP